MIQRIQTLYLVAVIALSITALFFPIAFMIVDIKGEQMTFQYFLLQQDREGFFNSNWLLLILQSVIVIISLITIFLYKNRMRQIRVLAFNYLVCIAYWICLWFFAVGVAQKDIPQGLFLTGSSYGLAAYFPLVQIFLLYLAQKAIKKDEILVRSSERLR
ncbi:MAG: DUF4293 domain-containing protein [Bacteroidales bacterium]|jgi:hypothetical protein|nr:DUF4293 domain-containing protein [Bacteroidales bacterium]